MGSDYSLIVQIVTGLLVIFFFVTIGFSHRTWRWHHMLILSCCFIALCIFTVLAAMTLKTHQGWRTTVQDLDKRLEEQQKLKDTIQFGEYTAEDTTASIRSVRAEISRVLVDRGRVWRNCIPGNFDGQTVTVTTSPADPAGAAAPKPNNIAPKTVLYAFKEIPNAENILVPSVYVGEFQVTAATDTTVTLSPNLPLDSEQLQQARTNDASWALYEIMPVDGHEFFAGMSEEQLRALIPNPGNRIPEAEYNEMIQSYARTGGPATDDDSPDHKWARVRFKQKKSVDVDNPEGNLEPRFFDAQGRAIMPRLQRGEPVTFEVGDTATLDLKTAQDWAAAGDVEIQETLYFRPLRDYAYIFHYLYNQREYIADRTAQVQAESESIRQSTMLAESQTAALAEEKAKLEADLAQYKVEQEEVTALAEALDAQSKELRQKLTEAYRANLALSAELAALQKQLADEIAKAEASKTASR